MKIKPPFLLLLSVLIIPTVYAEKASMDDNVFSMEELVNIPIEQLLNLQITSSVSKEIQTVHDSAAAVFIINSEDIRRSGVMNIPEALRMAPGLHVAQMNANQWAISSRGFNERASDKLLVLMDGRVLYHPSISGTIWENQDVVLDNIERIEVIRGSGATLWGANAVNGVINIISKQAEKTQGTQMSFTGGDDKLFGHIRHGFQLNEHDFGRVYFQSKRQQRYKTSTGGDNNDESRLQLAGFQLNLSAEDDDLLIQGRGFKGRYNQQSNVPTLIAPYTKKIFRKEDSILFSLLARWDKKLSSDSNFSLQAYYDYQQNEIFLSSTVHQFNIDFYHHLRINAQHNFSWGVTYHSVQDTLIENTFYKFTPENKYYQTVSGFMQDEFTLVPKILKIIIGTKIEHNDFSGFEYQPNVRFIWTPNKDHSLWGAVSRALKTPTRTQYDANTWAKRPNEVPATINGLPLKLEGVNDQVKSVETLSYELGYRFQFKDKFSLDVSLFYTNYDNLFSYELNGTPSVKLSNEGIPFISSPLTITNGTSGYSYGGELALSWQVTDFWRLNLGYSYFQGRFYNKEGGQDDESKKSPENQLSLRSSFDITDKLELDIWFRYIDTLKSVQGSPISDYSSLDLRLGYRPVENLEFSIIGRNLIEKHIEFRPRFVQNGNHSELDRHVYFQTTFNF
ncbi:MAG: TonB-dependent receptor [Methylococcales bacterium]|nr:TonB-dependent receptor [Methylococcales bacterium]